MAKKRPRLTPKEIEARRKNAQKSTGPRTRAGKRRAALNALQYGWYAQASVRTMSKIMAALGKDPAQFVRLLKDVLQSYPPRNALQMMMIAEDIARLRWHEQRNQRAQEAKLLRALQRLELDRHQRSPDQQEL